MIMQKEDRRLVEVIRELIETYTPDEVVEHLLFLLKELDKEEDL